GLHQAIEAKERVKVEAATQTFATITLQNYFRMYHKLAGMTGTAETEAGEFWNIYKLDVVVIPTNRPVIRTDYADIIYKTKREKYNAVIAEIERLVREGRPVLVGTTSVEISELLSRMLNMRHIPHNVLNAKLHQREAEIVAEAGRAGTVTIATNMAGRGTDIKLTEEVRAAGGLAIIGTERHESRRVDRQLRGRSGRQGDPGSSQFYVSLEDDLMRLFGSDRIAGMVDKIGIKDGEMIQSGMLTKSIERAQKKVEENNFGIRKHLLEYDDVMNSQREVIYTKRRNVLFGEKINVEIANMMNDLIETLVQTHKDNETFEDFKIDLIRYFAIDAPMDEQAFRDGKVQALTDEIYQAVREAYDRKCNDMRQRVMPVIRDVYEKQGAVYTTISIPITDGKRVFQIIVNLQKACETDGQEIIRTFEKLIMLHTIDEAWKEHLRELDDLRQSVRNATYEQKDPLLIYKFESFDLFKNMLEKINKDVVSLLMKGRIPVQETSDVKQAQQPRKVDMSRMQARKSEFTRSPLPGRNPGAPQQPEEPRVQTIVKGEKKIGRNDPCPCGSGKKYKNCHGRNMAE
ncbi:MAG: SEC-C domain-containing protein, partial [Bacteroidales bacterium]|nr:SEC-C domain-containing protein [Bacteroidales bacterium]